MTEARVQPFSSRAECEAQFRACIERAGTTLQMFDPDFAIFPLGTSEIDAALRRFLAGGGSLQLAMHASGHVERHYPRFLRLLRDYGHRIECRLTSRALRQLTDSFCIADGVHIVRRFHSDHPRGEAAFDAPADTELARERFAAIWAESRQVLQSASTGL
jgi:hypothetical protein